jgi:hypothetical protein
MQRFGYPGSTWIWLAYLSDSCTFETRHAQGRTNAEFLTGRRECILFRLLYMTCSRTWR